MTRHLKDLTFLGLPGVKGTGVAAEGAEITVAGDFCIVSAMCTQVLALEVSRLSQEGAWRLHGSPAHDGVRFHQWMISPPRQAKRGQEAK